MLVICLIIAFHKFYFFKINFKQFLTTKTVFIFREKGDKGESGPRGNQGDVGPKGRF